MKKNNIFRCVWSMAVFLAMFLSCAGEYPEIDESIKGEDPEQSEPGQDEPGAESTMPEELTVTLDFTQSWPFSQECATAQTEQGESYTYDYTYTDASGSHELPLTFKFGYYDKAGSAARVYSYGPSAAPDGRKAVKFATTMGMIQLPAIEGMYLKDVQARHYSDGNKRFALQENFNITGDSGNRLLFDSQKPQGVARFIFPVAGASQGVMESQKGKTYTIQMRDGDMMVYQIRLVYTKAKPVNEPLNLNGMHMYAHRGAWSKDAAGAWVVPENSLTGIEEAARQGFEGIECDVRYTSDGKMVVMHDGTINRTMCNVDGSEIASDVKVASTTFKDLRTKYMLVSTEQAFRRQIPTLEEMLLECKKWGIRPMLHSEIYESYELAQKIMGDNWVAFTAKFDVLSRLRQELGSKCTILWSTDSGTADEIKSKLQQLGGDCGISSMTFALYTPELIKSLRDAGYHVQSSIFPKGEELNAIDNGIDYLLTDRIDPAQPGIGGSVVDNAGKTPGAGHEDFTTIKPALNLSDGLQVLAIGNSFSVDAMEYLHGVLTDAGYENVILGNMYIGGCSLEKHVTNFSADKADYTYYKNTTGAWVTTKTTAPSTALLDEKWDYIMMQQVSQNSGMPETFDPYLQNLIDMVLAKCPNARLMWHMTWAYQGDSTHSGFANYNKDQMTMYNAIVNAVKTRIQTDKSFEKVIPCGTAVQNMRTSFHGDNLTRDGYHMSKDVGRFLTALTFAKALTGCSLDNITYKPSEHTYTDELISAMKDAAAKACEKPYEVTVSAYPTK